MNHLAAAWTAKSYSVYVCTGLDRAIVVGGPVLVDGAEVGTVAFYCPCTGRVEVRLHAPVSAWELVMDGVRPDLIYPPMPSVRDFSVN